jgi:hypothetical protein
MPEAAVLADLDVTRMTTWRWDRSAKMAKLGWPAVIRLNGNIFRSRRAYDAFKNNLAQIALQERPRLLAEGKVRKIA